MILVLTWFKHILPKDISAITLWPFIVCKFEHDTSNKLLINHEKIHLKQQIELGVILFYIIYLLEYLFGLLKYLNHHKAYCAISFEREAYLKDSDLEYLSNRKVFAMWRSHSKTK